MSEAMRRRSQGSEGPDPSGYEIRVPTSNMFAHLEDCVEARRSKTPGPRNQTHTCLKHTSAGKKAKEEVNYAEGEWALVTRRPKKRESPAKPANADADSTFCGHGDGTEVARRDPGREEAKDGEDEPTSEPGPEFNIDLDNDFPPLSRAGLPDGTAEEKPRRPARGGLHPEARGHSPARGDSDTFRGCSLPGWSGTDDCWPALASAADGETQASDHGSSQSEAQDPAVFQFFSDEGSESTDEEQSASEEEQLRDDLGDQGPLPWPPEKENEKEKENEEEKEKEKEKEKEMSLKPDAPSSSPGSDASVDPEGGGSSQLSAGDAIVQTAKTEAEAPGSSSEAPGSSSEAPGCSSEALGSSSEAPGCSSEALGSSAEAPGSSGEASGFSGEAPGSFAEAPGSSGEAPGCSAEAPGSSAEAPGSSVEAPGCSSEAPGSSAEEEYITVEELQEELSRLLEGNHSSQEIIAWLQATIADEDASSEDFLEVLMTCVCQSEVIICDVPYIDGRSMLRWTPLLKVFLQDQEKELTALKVLGGLMTHMQHPEGLLEMILDVLVDEEIIRESTFLSWKEAEERRGNWELLGSASRFFSWLGEYLG